MTRKAGGVTDYLAGSCVCVCVGRAGDSKQACGGEGWRAFQVSEQSRGGACGERGGERSGQADFRGSEAPRRSGDALGEVIQPGRTPVESATRFCWGKLWITARPWAGGVAVPELPSGDTAGWRSSRESLSTSLDAGGREVCTSCLWRGGLRSLRPPSSPRPAPPSSRLHHHHHSTPAKPEGDRTPQKPRRPFPLRGNTLLDFFPSFGNLRDKNLTASLQLRKKLTKRI